MMEKSSFLKTKHTPTRHLVAGTTQQLFSLWYLIQFCLAIFLHYLVGSQILDWFSCFLGVFTEKDCFRSICDIILSPYQALLWPSLLWTAPAKSESAIIMVEKEQGQLGAWLNTDALSRHLCDHLVGWVLWHPWISAADQCGEILGRREIIELTAEGGCL